MLDPENEADEVQPPKNDNDNSSSTSENSNYKEYVTQLGRVN